ncbi:MAG: glycosyltransferase family 4 protein, partial [Bacteroidales bacterium]|nr:glycosyltransferase family 4 protein [Bacteroidales bacterium]
FLDAAAQLKDELDFEIIFVFFKGDVKAIKDYAIQLGIGDRLHIFENVNYPYIPAIYNKSDILVLPEMGQVVANAGFPGKTSEYLASGKAVISTDFSNLKDVLKNNENVMMSSLGDLDAYVGNLRSLIRDPDLRSRLGVQALKTAIQYFDYKNGVSPLVDELLN